MNADAVLAALHKYRLAQRRANRVRAEFDRLLGEYEKSTRRRGARP